MPREDGFDITVASEIMAVLCLATGMSDLKSAWPMVVAYTRDDNPVTAHDLKAEGAMAAVLKDAIKPNLVQTLEGTPAFIHGGPSPILPTAATPSGHGTALKLGEYTVTEAGFAADLGAEKFLDIKCRAGGLPSRRRGDRRHRPRALKYHGGVAKADLNHENLEALERGLPNLLQHVDNVTNVYGLPCVVAINAFPTDTEAELKMVEEEVQ